MFVLCEFFVIFFIGSLVHSAHSVQDQTDANFLSNVTYVPTKNLSGNIEMETMEILGTTTEYPEEITAMNKIIDESGVTTDRDDDGINKQDEPPSTTPFNIIENTSQNDYLMVTKKLTDVHKSEDVINGSTSGDLETEEFGIKTTIPKDGTEQTEIFTKNEGTLKSDDFIEEEIEDVSSFLKIDQEFLRTTTEEFAGATETVMNDFMMEGGFFAGEEESSTILFEMDDEKNNSAILNAMIIDQLKDIIPSTVKGIEETTTEIVFLTTEITENPNYFPSTEQTTESLYEDSNTIINNETYYTETEKSEGTEGVTEVFTTTETLLIQEITEEMFRTSLHDDKTTTEHIVIETESVPFIEPRETTTLIRELINNVDRFDETTEIATSTIPQGEVTENIGTTDANNERSTTEQIVFTTEKLNTEAETSANQIETTTVFTTTIERELRVEGQTTLLNTEGTTESDVYSTENNKFETTTTNSKEEITKKSDYNSEENKIDSINEQDKQIPIKFIISNNHDVKNISIQEENSTDTFSYEKLSFSDAIKAFHHTKSERKLNPDVPYKAQSVEDQVNKFDSSKTAAAYSNTKNNESAIIKTDSFTSSDFFKALTGQSRNYAFKYPYTTTEKIPVTETSSLRSSELFDDVLHFMLSKLNQNLPTGAPFTFPNFVITENNQSSPENEDKKNSSLEQSNTITDFEDTFEVDTPEGHKLPAYDFEDSVETEDKDHLKTNNIDSTTAVMEGPEAPHNETLDNREYFVNGNILGKNANISVKIIEKDRKFYVPDDALLYSERNTIFLTWKSSKTNLNNTLLLNLSPDNNIINGAQLNLVKGNDMLVLRKNALTLPSARNLNTKSVTIPLDSDVQVFISDVSFLHFSSTEKASGVVPSTDQLNEAKSQTVGILIGVIVAIICLCIIGYVAVRRKRIFDKKNNSEIPK